jgi:hypothetical protein
MHNQGGNIYLYEGDKLEDFQELLGGAEESDIIKLSTLPKPVYNSGNHGGGIPCLTFDENLGRFVHSKMSVKYDDAIYFTEAHNKIHLYTPASTDAVETLLNNLLELGCDFEGTFYTVKPSMVSSKNLKGRPNWRSAKDVIEKCVQELLNERAESYYLLNHTGQESHLDVNLAQDLFGANQDVLDLVKEYQDYLEDIGNAKKNTAELSKLNWIITRFNLKADLSGFPEYKPKKFQKRFDKILSKYPLLKHIHYSNSNKSDLVQYINQIDQLETLQKV